MPQGPSCYPEQLRQTCPINKPSCRWYRPNAHQPGLGMADSDAYSVRLGGWLGAATLRALDLASRFDKKTVVLVGQLPFARGDMAELMPPGASVYSDDLPRDLAP